MKKPHSKFYNPKNRVMIFELLDNGKKKLVSTNSKKLTTKNLIVKVYDKKTNKLINEVFANKTGLSKRQVASIKNKTIDFLSNSGKKKFEKKYVFTLTDIKDVKSTISNKLISVIQKWRSYGSGLLEYSYVLNYNGIVFQSFQYEVFIQTKDFEYFEVSEDWNLTDIEQKNEFVDFTTSKISKDITNDIKNEFNISLTAYGSDLIEDEKTNNKIKLFLNIRVVI